MTTPNTAAPADPPFKRPFAVARLSREAETPFRVAAEPAELAELAPYLEVDRIDRLTLAGFISPAGNGGFRVRGRLVAQIEQRCVVTLSQIPVRQDAEIERLYLPEHRVPRTGDVIVLHDEEDEPDPFTDSIDPAQFAVESLLLMIDPYPRTDGAERVSQSFAAPGTEPLGDETSRPFDSLAALKDRFGDDKG